MSIQGGINQLIGTAFGLASINKKLSEVGGSKEPDKPGALAPTVDRSRQKIRSEYRPSTKSTSGSVRDPGIMKDEQAHRKALQRIKDKSEGQLKQYATYKTFASSLVDARGKPLTWQEFAGFATRKEGERNDG